LGLPATCSYFWEPHPACDNTLYGAKHDPRRPTAAKGQARWLRRSPGRLPTHGCPGSPFAVRRGRQSRFFQSGTAGSAKASAGTPRSRGRPGEGQRRRRLCRVSCAWLLQSSASPTVLEAGSEPWLCHAARYGACGAMSPRTTATQASTMPSVASYWGSRLSERHRCRVRGVLHGLLAFRRRRRRITPRSRADPPRQGTQAPRRAVAGSIVLRGAWLPCLSGPAQLAR
jgi:hypothetical protein